MWTVGVDTRTIRRWAKDEEWEIALGNVSYTGDRTFETQRVKQARRRVKRYLKND